MADESHIEVHHVNPVTGQPWTEAEFQAAEFGFHRLTGSRPMISTERGRIAAFMGVPLSDDVSISIGDVVEVGREQGRPRHDTITYTLRKNGLNILSVTVPKAWLP